MPLDGGESEGNALFDGAFHQLVRAHFQRTGEGYEGEQSRVRAAPFEETCVISMKVG